MIALLLLGAVVVGFVLAMLVAQLRGLNVRPWQAPEPTWDDLEADAINHYCSVCHARSGEPCHGHDGATHVMRIDPRFMDGH